MTGDSRLEFDEKQLPWIDRRDADIDRYVAALPAPDPVLAARLTHFRERGFVVLPRAIDPRLIDAYLADLDEIVAHHEQHDFGVVPPGRASTVPLRALSRPEVLAPHVRFCDLHNASIAGKKLALARPVVELVRHLFCDQIVAMQSLTFRYGSEQDFHQDFAYVVAPGNPSHLAAAWIALEDVHPDAGPLAYFPGSHRIRKFDWGNGLFYDPERSTRHGFQDHILAECARLGLSPETFIAEKGDAFIWHGALAHGGTPVRDPRRTRLSFVTHYSSVSAYPRSSRRPDLPPERFELNGAVVYGDPTRPTSENLFRRGVPL